MNIFTLLLLFVCIAFGVSDDPGEHGRHGYRVHRDYRDHHDDDHHDDQDHHDDHDDDHHDVPHGVTEGDVIYELLSRHANHGRPGGNSPVEVGIGLFVEAVTEVNEEEGYVEISGFLSIKWVDSRLRFRYGHPFHEVHDVRLAKADLWLPDIELYNQVSHGVEVLNSANYQAVVEYNGTVKWYPMITARARCAGLNNQSEEIRCQFKFGSWTYSGSNLDLQILQSMPVLSQYKASGHWIATDSSTKRSAIQYACCPDSYVDVTFTLTLKREHY